MKKVFVINYMMCLDPSKINNAKDLLNETAGNLGNSYITYSLIKELFGWNCEFKGIQNIWSYNYNNIDRDLDYINDWADFVFLNLQDHIRPVEINFDCDYVKLANFLKKIKKQICVIGLGANSYNGLSDTDAYKRLPESTLNLLNIISYQTSCIGVRGEFSFEILRKIGINNCEVIGCPSFYEMGEKHQLDIKTIDLNNIVFTNVYKLGITDSFPVVLQSEEHIIDAVFGNPDKFFCNDGQLKSFFNDYINGNFYFFTSILEWKKFLSKFSLAIGSRVHGSIIAVNSNVPAICLNSDARSQEMCNLLGIPCLFLNKKLDPKDIIKFADFTKYNNLYSSNYKNYADFIFKLTGIDIYKVKHFNMNNFFSDIDSTLIFKNSIRNLINYSYSLFKRNNLG